jgi:hypothetical protein
MLALLPFLLMAAQADEMQVTPPPVSAHRHSIAWETLPPMPYRETPRVTAAMTEFVVGEVRRGRCRANLRGEGRHAVQVDVAVLVSADDGARVTIPRAIDCATVEQYASGLVLGFARNNLAQRASMNTQWYRATLVFEWPA